jgi:hypothetical protein
MKDVKQDACGALLNTCSGGRRHVTLKKFSLAAPAGKLRLRYVKRLPKPRPLHQREDVTCGVRRGPSLIAPDLNNFIRLLTIYDSLCSAAEV